MLHRLCTVVVGLLLALVLCGCQDSRVEIGLMIIDRFSPGAQGLEREVVLILPEGDAGQDVMSRLLVQAQSEGWITVAGPGAAQSIGDHYQDTGRLSHELNATELTGEVMSARRAFAITQQADAGVFTALFAPAYRVGDGGHGKHSATGHIAANAIWRAIQAESARYLTSRGYSAEQLAVGFQYPVAWTIICSGRDVTTTRGKVHTYGREALVQTNMYGPEFLAEMPITVEWREPSYVGHIMILAVVLAALAGAVLYIAARSRAGRNAPGPPIGRQ